jgi:hypothetical protein
VAELEERFPKLESKKGNGASHWIQNCHWDQRHSEEALHAARLLLLLNVCGVAGRIDGLTKMAKLDFFARYPDFFEVARAASTPAGLGPEIRTDEADLAVESAMVRHHYGPWDKRYYHVLAQLEAKRLIKVEKDKNAYRLMLTDLGKERAKALAAKPSFAPLIERMRQIKKDLIYRLFDEEVGQQQMGQVIRQ